MKLIQTKITDVVIIEPTVFEDERGWFMESFNEKRFHDELEKLGLSVPRPFVQDNHSCSKKGVLRGLHYQLPPHPQGKLVRVTKGSAFDVAVDIREGSPTFGQWVGLELSAENQKILWIPEGFAHGFVALQDDTQFLYKATDFYSKDCERSLKWNDPTLMIDWPFFDRLSISEKDQVAPYLDRVDKAHYLALRAEKELVELKAIGDEGGGFDRA